MKKQPSIVFNIVAALIMMGALLFLTTANFWVYGFSSEKTKQAASIPVPVEEKPDGAPSVPNPVEEKTSNTLQNISEFLHENYHPVAHPEYEISFGNRHDIIHFPIHHLELITPPPKPFFLS